MSAAKSDGEVITTLNANDVLFGRGSGPNDHEGNIRFRALVSERKAEYMATNHRQTKAKIARDIVDTVLSKSGRFLKKIEPNDAKRFGLPKGVDAWTVVDDETIMEKAKQALRQQRDKGKSKSPTRGKQAATTLPPIQVESYVPSTAYQMRSQGLTQTGQLRIDPSLSSAYPHQTQIQPNPYEPIPIGGTISAAEQNLDWRGFAAAAIAAQTPSMQDYNPSPQLELSSQASVRQQQQQVTAETVESLGPPANRRDSIQVIDLMDSFNKMKTKELDGDDNRNNYESTETMGTIGSLRNNESTDTMGTIEPIPMAGNSREGGISLTGSALSLMKGALADSSRNDFKSETSLGEGKGPDKLKAVSRQESRQSISVEDKDFFIPPSRRAGQRSSDVSNLSMSLSQVLSDRRVDAIKESEHEEEDNKKLADDPRPVLLMEDEPDNMSTLGKSSMSILNIAMGEDSGILTAANESIFSDIGD